MRTGVYIRVSSPKGQKTDSQRAEETLADRRHFGLDAEQWTVFMAALDAPPRRHARLERLLQEPSIMENTTPDHGPT